jgi:hypothetical protein
MHSGGGWGPGGGGGWIKVDSPSKMFTTPIPSTRQFHPAIWQKTSRALPLDFQTMCIYHLEQCFSTFFVTRNPSDPQKTVAEPLCSQKMLCGTPISALKTP